MNKKILIVVLALLLVFAFTISAFAGHPPIDKINKKPMPAQAAKGLHNACGHLDEESIAYHVHLYFLSPHAITE